MSKRAVLEGGKKAKRVAEGTRSGNAIKCSGCGRPIIVGMHPGVIISNVTFRCQCGVTTTVNAKG